MSVGKEVFLLNGKLESNVCRFSAEQAGGTSFFSRATRYARLDYP